MKHLNCILRYNETRDCPWFFKPHHTTSKRKQKKPQQTQLLEASNTGISKNIVLSYDTKYLSQTLIFLLIF